MSDTKAPFVYFENIGAVGALPGIIQMELTANALDVLPENQGINVTSEVVARLRCSPYGIRALMNALEGLLETEQRARDTFGGGPDELPPAN